MTMKEEKKERLLYGLIAVALFFFHRFLHVTLTGTSPTYFAFDGTNQVGAVLAISYFVFRVFIEKRLEKVFVKK